MTVLAYRRAGAILAGLALMLALSLLAGACGGSSSSATSTPAAGETTAAASATAEAKLTIISQVARSTINDTTGVYFTVKNPGAADRLVSVSVDPAVAGMAQIHETVAEGATMKMQEVKGGIVVPAGGTLELKPGGYHVMLMNVKKPLNAGDSLKLDVVFEKAGTISLVVPVQDIAAATGTAMSGGGMTGGAMTATVSPMASTMMGR